MDRKENSMTILRYKFFGLFFLLLWNEGYAQHLPEKILLDGGEFSAGYITSNDSAIGTLGIAVNGNYNNRRFTLGKYDSGLYPMWTKGYGDHTICSFEMNDLLFLSDGGFIIAGTKRDSISGITSGINLRMDSSGNIIYAHEIVDSMSNNAALQPMGLLSNSDSTYILLSRLWNEGSVGISLVDLSGQIIQTQHFRAFVNNHTAFYQRALRRANGNYVVICKDYYNPGSIIMFLEFSAQLNLVSHFNYYVDHVGLECLDITEDVTDQSVLITGYDSNSNGRHAFVLKLDQQGNVIWSKSIFPVSDHGALNNVMIKDNAYYFTGMLQQDLVPFVVVTDTAGNILNSETYRHPGQFTFFGRAIDMQDSLMIPFSGEINGDYGPGSLIIDSTLHSACSADETTFTDSLFSFTLNQDLFADTTHLIFIDHTSEYYDTTYTNISIDYCQTTTVSDKTDAGNDVTIYMREKTLTIQIVNNEKYSDLFLFDTSGRLITQRAINSETTNVDLSLLSGGVYFMSVKGSAKICAKKFVYTGSF